MLRLTGSKTRVMRGKDCMLLLNTHSSLSFFCSAAAPECTSDFRIGRYAQHRGMLDNHASATETAAMKKFARIEGQQLEGAHFWTVVTHGEMVDDMRLETIGANIKTHRYLSRQARGL